MVTKYIDIADIESYLGVTFDTSTTPSLTQMTNYLDLAEDEFENDVGIFSTQTVSNEITSGQHFGLIVKKLPLNTISKIYIDRGNLFNRDWSELESTEWYIENYNIGTIYLKTPIVGEQNYKISYTSGYSKLNMPKRIKHLVMLYTLRHAFKNTLFATNGNVGGTTQTIDVQVYREVTNGGNPYNGISSLDNIIEDQKRLLLKGIKVFVI